MDRVNLLNPFGPSATHENRLTWAFLLVVKYDPLLQNFLRERVEAHLPPRGQEYHDTWESVRVSTQTKWIGSTTTPLVSVLLTDAPIQEEIAVEWSDRDPIYDGIIEYPNRMTLIIENKLDHEAVWKEQLSPKRCSFPGEIDNDTLHGSAVCLEWSEVLEGILRYTDSSFAPFGNREIARDFLSFVEEFHPRLTPYRTYGLCGNRPAALHRRTVHLVEEIARLRKLDIQEKQGSKYLCRSGKIAQVVIIRILEAKPWRLRVHLWPASTASQADEFSEKVDKERFLALNQEGWAVEPNLNFSYMGTKLIWAESTCGTGPYLAYFFSGEKHYGQKKFDNKLSCSLLDEWQYRGLITQKNREEIEGQRQTRKQYLNVNPEFSVYRDWDQDTVIKLEEQEKLEADIIQKLDVPLATWGEQL